MKLQFPHINSNINLEVRYGWKDYTETAVAIPEVVEAFKKAGYKGYLSSEYEGGEHLRADMEVDSIEQVRRHQEAMRRAIEG